MSAGQRSTRGFRISDAMILIAATGIGFSLVRLWSVGGFSFMFRNQGPPIQRLLLGVSAAFLVWPLVACWTLATLVLAIRPPHPRWRHLMRRPGVVAGMMVSFGSVVNLALIGVFALKVEDLSSGVALVSGFPIGLMVLTGWGYQLLSGRWRPDPSWIDRMGRVFGFYWSALVPSYLVLIYFLVS